MALENFRSQKIIWDRANKKIFETIEANSGDSNGRKLVVQVINQETTENLFGTTLSLGWKSRNGAKGLDTFNVVDASKGIFEIYYTTEMLSNIGNLEASLILIDSTSRIESSTFTISVRPSTVDDESVESENSFTALTEALVKVNDFDAQLAQKASRMKVDTLEERVDDILQSADLDPNKDQEVVDARDGKSTLGSNIRSIEERRQQLENDILGERLTVDFATSTRNQVSEENYLIIPLPAMEVGVKYALEFVPNSTFTHNSIQIGTQTTSASMVDTLATDVSFVSGESFWIDDYSPSKENLRNIRMAGNALKIDHVKVYTYTRNPDGRLPTIESRIDSVEDELFGRIERELFNTTERAVNAEHYFLFANPKLTLGERYAFEIIPNETFYIDGIQIGTAAEGTAVVDTLAEGVSFVAGETYWIEDYVASQDNLGYIRILDNALKIDTINIYTYKEENGQPSTDPVSEENDFHIATRLNANIADYRQLKNAVDKSLSSLTQVQTSEGISKNITLPSVGERKKYIYRVGLHYGSERYTPSPQEIFLNGQSKKDFSDVRFFDSNGKMLKAQLGKPVNMDLLEDDNLNSMLKTLSDGTIVGFKTGQGVMLSTDNGVTYTAIPNTANVSVIASDTYKRKDMYPVFVDSGDNIYAYAGGILYKLYASTNYSTRKEVLTFTWDNNGTTIYPDIQDHAMDESQNGTLIVGADYQALRHARLFRSLDGGETFEVSWFGGFGTDFQHTHHIHADPYSNKVYAGVDDGGTTFLGARILVTDDDGDTWTDITDNFDGIRGKDYYPTYFGDNYRLGGGESYLNGGGAIYKANGNDSNLEVKVKGLGGVRSYADFGTDDLIVAGLQHARGNSVNQILISDDKGDSWDVIYSKQQAFRNSSGGGFRRGYNATVLQGDTEPCIVLSGDFGNVKPMRIYKGDNHYYREAYIELENIPDAPIELTVKTGYMMAYPYDSLNGREHEGLVYNVALNEGVGSYVQDNLGNIVKISGNEFEWERNEEPVRFGDYMEYGKPLVPSSGIKLGKGTTINFGKIPQLNFSKGYTITLWVNNKNKFANQDAYSARAQYVMSLFSAGNVSFFKRVNEFGYTDNETTDSGFSLNNSSYSMMAVPANGVIYSEGYHFVAISVDEVGHVAVKVNGGSEESRSVLRENKLFTLDNLSSGDFVIGSENLSSGLFISDIKIFNRVIDEKEVMELYKGW